MDVTYRVCKEGVSLLLFVGINTYGKSFILMGCFLPKEDIPSFQFALESFTLFGFKTPGVCITDQDKALTAALSRKWPQTTHLFCLFHIYRNIQQNAARFLSKKNNDFLKDFSKVQRVEVEEDFIEAWEKLVQDYCSDERTKINKERKEEIKINKEIEENSVITDDYSYISSDKESQSSEQEEEEDEESDISEINNIENSGSVSLSNFKNYLGSLYEKRKSWARCFTYKHFAAGNIFFFNFPIIDNLIF